jgi:hypothetical protein
MNNKLTKANLVKSLLIAITLFGFTAFTACEQITLPTDDNTTEGIVANGNQNNNDFGTNGTDENLAIGERPNAPKRIPLPCLKLTREQMQLVSALNKKYDSLRRLANIEHKNAVLELRKQYANTNNSGTTSSGLTDAEKARLEELRAQEKAIMEKLQSQERTFKSEQEAIMKKYREQINSTRDEAERKRLMEQQNAEIKELNARREAATRELKSQLDSIKKEREVLERKAKGTGERGGKISDELKTKLAELEKALREKMAALDAAYMEEFRSILTDEQKAILDEWLKTGKGCDRRTNTRETK